MRDRHVMGRDDVGYDICDARTCHAVRQKHNLDHYHVTVQNKFYHGVPMRH